MNGESGESGLAITLHFNVKTFFPLNTYFIIHYFFSTQIFTKQTLFVFVEELTDGIFPGPFLALIWIAWFSC